MNRNEIVEFVNDIHNERNLFVNFSNENLEQVFKWFNEDKLTKKRVIEKLEINNLI